MTSPRRPVGQPPAVASDAAPGADAERGAPAFAGVPVWAAALAGIVAASVAIAVSELAAGLTGSIPSLVVAIGTLVIDLQPPGAKDVVVALFGTNDKPALMVAVLAGALIIAAIAGVLARRRFALGAMVFVAFGAAAAFAAARQAGVGAAEAIATSAVAVTAGILTLRGLMSAARLGSRAGPAGTSSAPAALVATPSSPTPGPSRTGPVWDRRRFLIASAGTLGVAVVTGGIGRRLLDDRHVEGVVSTSRLPVALQPAPTLGPGSSLDVSGITPLVVPNEAFYRIDTALLVPNVNVETWSLKVTGMVERPLSFTYDDLFTMPLVEQYVTISCVSNRVGGDLVGNALWTGVRLKEVLALAGVRDGATQIVGRSVDGFTAGFPTAWALETGREPLVAVGMNGEPLPADHGFPARLIVPGLYGYVSATKWLAEIELTTREAVDGYWVPLGWAKDAPILTQSRIDVPQGGASVPVGPTTIAGMAWAPDRGIEKVEVRVDDGDWRAATLSRPLSSATWVQWELAWDAEAGSHPIEVRATDGTGETQTAESTPPAPDGARGHHRITVTVA